jgi:hypothetical protein
VKKAIVLLVFALAGGCAATINDTPQGESITTPSNCGGLSGRYLVDARKCSQSGDRLPKGVSINTLPGWWRLPTEPQVMTIRQTSCESVVLEVSSSQLEPGKTNRITVGHRTNEPHWLGEVLVADFRGRSNLPPPIQLGSSGGFFWSLARSAKGSLSYVVSYEEKGLAFMILPHHTRREMRCTFERVE